MSQENVEAFKRGLEAGNRGDVETLLEVLDPEVEWHSALHALLGGEQTVFRGHDGVREMLRDLYEAFGEIHIEISEIRDLGDRLVAIGRTRTRGKESGAETETPLALVTEVKNGKTISIRGYPRSQGGPRSRRAVGVAREVPLTTRSGYFALHGKRGPCDGSPYTGGEPLAMTDTDLAENGVGPGAGGSRRHRVCARGRRV